jgi:hypothetical protein
MRLLHLRVGPASTLGGLRAPSPSTHSSVMAFYLCGSASVSLLFFSSSRAPHSRRASTASRSLVFKAVAFCRSRPLSTSLSLSLSLLLPCRAVLLVSFCFDRIREPGEGARATAAGSGRRRWVGAFPAGDGRGSVRRRGGRFARGQAVRGRRSGAGDGARTPLACLRVRVRRAENR